MKDEKTFWDTLKSYNRSKYLIGLVLILTIAVMFILNVWTRLVCDDYIYALTFDDHTRFLSLGQLVGSMRSHYGYMNGRLILHSIVQILLIGPNWIFDVLNTLVFVGLLFEMYYYSWYVIRKQHNVLALLAIIAAIWYFTPVFGHVFLWEDGSVNYSWAAFFVLSYCIPVVNTFWNHKKHTLWFKMGYAILGLCMGALSESFSMAAMGMLFLGFFACFLLEKLRDAKWLLCPLPFMMVGYFLMNISPGTRASKLDGKKSFLLTVWSVTMKYVNKIGIIALFWLIFAVVCVVIYRKYRQRNQQEEAAVLAKGGMYSVWLMCIALAVNYLHSFANRYPGRSMLATTVFTIMALVVLWANLSKERMSGGFVVLSAACIAAAAFTFYPAVKDIHYMYLQLRQNEAYIMEQKAEGNMDIELPLIKVKTRYAAAYKLRYLSTKDATTWPNTHMATYYGVNSLIGVKNKK